jgi:hypothetical protein
MIKRQRVVLVLCLILGILNISSVSSAAPQIVGTKCAKAGTFRTAKNVKFQCKKSSQGLRWVITPTKSTTPTTNTTMIPTTTTSTIPVPVDEVARKIHDVALAATNNLAAAGAKIEYLSEAPTNVAGEEAAKKGVDQSLKFFSQLGFELPSTVIVLFAQTESGLRSTLINQGCDSQALRSSSHQFLSATGSALGGTCGSGRVAVIAGPISQWSRDQQSIDFQHTLPHEIFHQWQMNSTSWCGSWRCGNSDFPRWLFEGTPQLMTRLAYWSWNKSKTHQQWHDYWYTSQRPDMRSMCVGVPIEEMIVPWTPWPGPGWCAYSKGQLAIEVLIANYGGFENLKKLHTTKTRAGYTNFPEHFRNVTGKDISEFYAEVNSYFAKRGWN